MHCVYANIFGAIVLILRFKIDAVVIVTWSIVIIINSVLTLQVSTASLPHDHEPCEIKVVSNHTCSLHTCVCAGSRRVRIRLSGFRRQGISSTPGGFHKCPIPVRVCTDQIVWKFISKQSEHIYTKEFKNQSKANTFDSLKIYFEAKRTWLY